MGNDTTKDLAHQLRQALGEKNSTNAERVLRELMLDDMARNELFIRLTDGEREPLLRLWENFGPGPRVTHEPGPGFRARVRWDDQATAMRRGALRAALAREFGDARPDGPGLAAAPQGKRLRPHALPARVLVTLLLKGPKSRAALQHLRGGKSDDPSLANALTPRGALGQRALLQFDGDHVDLTPAGRAEAKSQQEAGTRPLGE